MLWLEETINQNHALGYIHTSVGSQQFQTVCYTDPISGAQWQMASGQEWASQGQWENLPIIMSKEQGVEGPLVLQGEIMSKKFQNWILEV